MNKAVLVGNVANDPEVRQTTSGVTCCTFRVATQRRYTDPKTGKKEADFHTVVAWRQLGELCAKYLAKGRKCAVEGAIQYHSYTGRDGVKRYATEIIAEDIEFLSSPQQSAETQAQAPAQAQTDGFTPADDDDELPF